MLAMLVMLVSITACVSVCLTYSMLIAEDYRWWWRSVFNLGSSALFVFAYAVVYVATKTQISGLLQISQFLVWTVLTCYAVFLAVGTVSFFASFTFVKYIYRSVKID
jgi:transmembrane 9 superfamily protein 1